MSSAKCCPFCFCLNVLKTLCLCYWCMLVLHQAFNLFPLQITRVVVWIWKLWPEPQSTVMARPWCCWQLCLEATTAVLPAHCLEAAPAWPIGDVSRQRLVLANCEKYCMIYWPTNCGCHLNIRLSSYQFKHSHHTDQPRSCFYYWNPYYWKDSL